jgi:SAM-dependent methyltransferase
LKHENCGGEISVIELTKQGTVSLKCLNCGKVWKVCDDFADIRIGEQRRDESSPSVFYQFAQFHRNPILNLLLNYRLICLVNLANVTQNEDHIGLDIGCQTGYLSKYFTDHMTGTFIGMDLSRIDLSRAKLFARLRGRSKADFELVLADINFLPFKKESIHLIVCASVLEHIKNIKDAIKQLRNVIKKDGYLIAGYPLETQLFIGLVKLVSPEWMKIRDPRILGKEKFDLSPDTHKQSFIAIREALQESFIVVRRKKSFFSIFPDFLSWYECVSLKKEKSISRPQNSS